MNKPNELPKWDQLARPPESALKQIKGGRLSGMTDVNPQWRYKAMHDAFGPCGEGWKYEVVRVWTEPGAGGQVFMFAQINAYVKHGDAWSDPIPGVGGSMLLETQKGGLHHNDEAVKMAVTDALSVSLKMLGVAADIYMGRWDGSKYKDEPKSKQPSHAITPTADAWDRVSEEERTFLTDIALDVVAMLEGGNARDAVKHIQAQRLDADETVAIWTRFDSKQRSAMKKAKAEMDKEELINTP